ncbi:MAG: DUF4346 domain-containing protein [Cyanobacteria bacterium REEB459]|nr:DUF4346 domain-containing protein [Cyanobacteria bacterium REEB459]
MSEPAITVNQAELQALDDHLSKRFIKLDPGGYFIIYLDHQQGLIYAKHFTNTINHVGLACDPGTGQPLPVRGNVQREPREIYSGRTAKELCIAIFENSQSSCPITCLDHAAYLGREFMRAEAALVSGAAYVQD